MICVECGKETAGGQRHRLCHGRYVREVHATVLAESDTAILKMRDEEHLSAARIGARIGVSRDRAYHKIKDARRRQRIRDRLPSEG